jgi:DNA-nicking Smr family endonuclease
VEEKQSIYQVFRRLPDFVRDHSILLAPEGGAPADARMSTPVEEETDENEAFLKAMKDVRKVDRKKERVRKAAEELHLRPPREAGPTMEEILDERTPVSVVNLSEYREGYVDGLNPFVLEKLRNGEFSIQRALDLHGLSAHEAYDAFHTFLGEAVQSQLRCVKIIHGRGLKSRQGPVLKEKLKEWIVRAMHRKWVLAFASARMADGGPGATTILLRARARKEKLHIFG